MSIFENQTTVTILINGLIPTSIFDLLGINGSNLSGVKNKTNNINSGKSEYTKLAPQTLRGRYQP